MSLSFSIFFSSLLSILLNIHAAVVIHKTPIGVFYGESINIERHTVERYLGIRYGQIFERFSRSKPTWISLNNENITHNAQNWPVACVQQPGFLGEWMNNRKSSEDCLFLNLWRPQPYKGNTNDLNFSSPSLFPVFVFFHGGSFISESISRKSFDGAQLAIRLNAIVITVNYRLDAFGFLYVSPPKINQNLSRIDWPKGNQALWDQLLALEWIQDNIEFFAGNPKRVTIAGQNSGATSVSVHLLSPLSRRHFQKAILQSGSIFNQLVVLNEKSHKKVSNMWASSVKKMECFLQNHNNQNEWTTKVVECLKKAPQKSILKLLDPLSEKTISPQVIIGDELFPFSTVIEAIDNLKDLPTEIDILIGSTDDEGGVVLPILDTKTYDMLSPKKITIKDAKKELQKYSKLLVPPTGYEVQKIDGNDVAKQYFINTKDNKNHENNLHRKIGSALGDFYVTCPMREFSKRLVRTGQINLYQYVWSIKISFEHAPCADWMGACSGTDTAILFGVPFNSGYNDSIKELSKRFIQTVKQFVHFGAPESQEGKSWPSYEINNTTGILNAPYYEFTSRNKHRVYGFSFRQAECDNVWSKYLLPV